MPRPRKTRRCCGRLNAHVYKPAGVPLKLMEEVQLAIDEIEALRLCDLEGLTQEEAGSRMKVSRGTVQRIVNEARRKIIEAFIKGQAIVFEEEYPVNCDKRGSFLKDNFKKEQEDDNKSKG